jgi:hypothetical protein
MLNADNYAARMIAVLCADIIGPLADQRAARGFLFPHEKAINCPNLSVLKVSV